MTRNQKFTLAGLGLGIVVIFSMCFFAWLGPSLRDRAILDDAVARQEGLAAAEEAERQKIELAERDTQLRLGAVAGPQGKPAKASSAQSPIPESVRSELASNSEKVARLRKQIVDDSAPFQAQIQLIHAENSAGKFGPGHGAVELQRCAKAIADISRRITPLIGEVQLRDVVLRQTFNLDSANRPKSAP